MAIEVKAFKCGFCHRCFGRINNARIHEDACKNNPARRQCVTCIHGTIDAIAMERDSENGSYTYTYYGAPYCAHHGKPIIEKPYFIECDSDDGGGWYEDRPLPSTCHHYEYKGKPGWTKREREETEKERESRL